MVIRIDKRQRSDLFRQRLAKAMAAADQNQSGLARDVGIDRSTISQLLDGTTARLPNAQVAAECARALGVSTDWLLGLTDQPEPFDQRLERALSLSSAPRALIDETIFGWHSEAAGYKIRHVPATLPDMIKTRAMLEWEYSQYFGASADAEISASLERLARMRAARSDYEIAFPLHEMAAFAAAEGYYTGLSAEIRIEQLDRLLGLIDELYPSLRIYLFDARRVFSAPITVFGPFLAVVYLGRNYLAFRDAERVASLSQQFDWLIRDATVGARELPEFLRGLRDGISKT